MKFTRADAEKSVSRLGAIGNHEWWHCRTCGGVWATPRTETSTPRLQAATEARLHVATHAQSEHLRHAAWQRTPPLRAMEKHR
jgi:hypothetical protein